MILRQKRLFNFCFFKMNDICDSLFAYRLPGEGAKIYSAKGKAVAGIVNNSFLIAPFEDPGKGFLSVSNLSSSDLSEADKFLKNLDNSTLKFKFPTSSSTKAEHKKVVEEIIRDTNMCPERKTIAARVIVEKEKIDIESSFRNLCKAFPNAFIFLFITPTSGCWLGASPELLLKSSNQTLHTYALAGTRPAETDNDWDYKNIREHLIVKQYIEDVFLKWGLNPVSSPLSTISAGNVEHLFTDIRATKIPQKVKLSFPDFISSLSPTPALCGYPKENSMKFIKKHEPIPRAYYGGFCGPYTNLDNFSLFVNLRSIWISDSAWSMFVGGGITCYSDPESEWDETVNKSAGIIENLVRI